MKNSFVAGMQADSNITYTENGATALKSTSSSLVDMFGLVGAMRSRDVVDIENHFAKAFAEDNLLATKLSFYARNIRGGLGERKTARIIWRWLANTHTDIMRKNLQYVPFFGRWDDLYYLLDTPVEQDVWELIREQYKEDSKAMEEHKSVSIMAKWLKNANSKNAEYAKWGKKTARALHMSDKEYRKAMAALRKYLDVVEVKMSKGDFTSIIYSAVSSRAMLKYGGVFRRHDADGFQGYLDSLKKGESKVNASTLYPYDILEAYRPNMGFGGSKIRCQEPYNEVLEQQWKALPNYVNGEYNALVMADTSGSMYGHPLCVAISLAMYFAERNKGAFKDVFMTFSTRPNFVTLPADLSVRDRVSCIETIISNTNIEAAFRKILKVAQENNVPAEDMPKALIIISDMEFDMATYGSPQTYYDHFKSMYEMAGYELPTIIFWNVESRHDVFHVACDKPGVQLASGASASTFQAVMRNIGRNPYEAVVETLSDKTYDVITV